MVIGILKMNVIVINNGSLRAELRGHLCDVENLALAYEKNKIYIKNDCPLDEAFGAKPSNIMNGSPIHVGKDRRISAYTNSILEMKKTLNGLA